jgi:TolA-binding protein
MTRSEHIIAAGLLVCSLAAPVWGQEYLYKPQPVDSGEKEKGAAADGVLVREIEVRRGDTLHDISRTYSGHASYFPQILLFNNISNPDLILAGTTLRIPVSHAEPASRIEKPLVKRLSTLKRSKKIRNHSAINEAHGVNTSVKQGDSLSAVERILFEKAVAAYKKDDYSTALELFGQYLSSNPGSPRAAEASLYKADCYLKLSVQ